MNFGGIHIPEPDTVLTDFALALECLIFIWLLHKRPRADWKQESSWFFLIFGATVLASTLGGISHLLDSKSSLLFRIVWGGTLWAVGLNGVAILNLSAAVALPQARLRRFILWLSLGYLVAYSGYVLTGARDFLVGILSYLPSVVCLLIAICVQFFRRKERPILYGLSAVILTIVAAAVQQLQVDLHEVYFTSNAFFHLIQVVAMYFFYKYAVWLAHS